MKVKDLVESIREQEKEKLGKMPKAKIALIVREALRTISEELDQVENGKIRVPGLGSFVVRELENEQKGKRQKRILLQRSKK